MFRVKYGKGIPGIPGSASDVVLKFIKAEMKNQSYEIAGECIVNEWCAYTNKELMLDLLRRCSQKLTF